MSPYLRGLHDHLFDSRRDDEEEQIAPRHVTWDEAITKGSELVASLSASQAETSRVLDYGTLEEHGYIEETTFSRPNWLKPVLDSLGMKLADFTEWGVNYEPYDNDDDHSATFDFLFHPTAGAIIVNYLRSPLVPILRSFPGRASDVLFLGYRHACQTHDPPLSLQRLRYLFILDVDNESSLDAINRALESVGTRLRAWPGTEFVVDDEEEEVEGLALLGCPSGRMVAYFLLQHKPWFGCKRVKRMRVFGTETEKNIMFEIEDASFSRAD